MKSPGETIWKGKPHYKARWAFLEIFSGSDSGPFLPVMPTIVLFSVLGLVNFIYKGEIIGIILMSIVVFIILFWPEIHKRKRRGLTSYKLTTNEIEINTYWYGKFISCKIPLSEVSNIYLENYIDDCGIIHVYSNSNIDLITRNFWSGERRPNITLEDISNSEQVFNIFKDVLNNYRINQKDIVQKNG